MGSWWSSEGGNVTTFESAPPNGVTKISNSVYSFSTQSAMRPEMEIVFIHGLPISGAKEEYWRTWTAEEKDEDGSDLIWPVKWLREQFPRTRIWSLRYDSSALKPAGLEAEGFTVGEHLMREMVTIAKVGQQSNCPLVFACHSLGGLLAKEMVIQAHRKCGKNKKYASFLQNIRGFQFFATPHDGSKLPELASHLPELEPELVKKLEVVNDGHSRLNKEFERVQKEYSVNKWQFAVIAETLKTESHGFSGTVVEKASSQHGYKRFVPVQADHFGVCKPKNRLSKSYKAFTEFILDLGVEAETLTWVNPPENHNHL